MNEKLKDINSTSRDEDVLKTLQRMEKHLQDLVYYMTPERAFLPSAGRVAAPATSSDSDLSESKIRKIVTQEVKKYLKEKR